MDTITWTTPWDPRGRRWTEPRDRIARASFPVRIVPPIA
jgi:hypothetical protein